MSENLQPTCNQFATVAKDTNVPCKDLISRQAAIDAHELLLKDCNPDHFVAHEKFIGFMDDTEIGSFGDWQFANGFNLALTAGEVAIKEQPSAERKGAWINNSPVTMKCGQCGYVIRDWRWNELNFCANCGADMRGEEDG